MPRCLPRHWWRACLCLLYLELRVTREATWMSIQSGSESVANNLAKRDIRIILIVIFVKIALENRVRGAFRQVKWKFIKMKKGAPFESLTKPARSPKQSAPSGVTVAARVDLPVFMHSEVDRSPLSPS
ncbi:hypothetical protein B0H14DRAFT_3428440 [Mycena olivaceomarginata]|nr:hypothetical protein B0H14DRAFT_3428440 [Mycena olivaceomarginata]